MEKILISACLLGQVVRYNAEKILVENLFLDKWRQEGRLVPLCPEVQGGLPVPRPPAEICGGDGAAVLAKYARLINLDNIDVTVYFLKGAQSALLLARKFKIKMAILKESSPSCGVHLIYDGTFSGTKVRGTGLTSTLLKNNGIRVFNELEIDQAAAFLEKL